MGTAHKRQFWSQREEYHDVAEAFDRYFEYEHPNYITRRVHFEGSQTAYVIHDGWTVTSVKYPRCPNVQNL